MTRYEKLVQELTIERMAEYFYDIEETYCKTICKTKSGDEYTCPYQAIKLEQCHKCAMEYLMMEVE